MERITKQMLQRQVDLINNALGTPLLPWSKTGANIGNYHISGAYGGVNLCRMDNESGGVENVFGHGHIPKRDLYCELCAFLAGIDAAKARE